MSPNATLDLCYAGSLGWQAYVRFLVWLVVSMAVYLLYSVHQPQPGKSPQYAHQDS